MKFNTVSAVEEKVWDMRLADQPRGADRAILLKSANGYPPFDEAEEEKNNIEVNISDLSHPNLLSKARQQWNNAFLKPSNFFTARPDSGPGHKRAEWSSICTKHANRPLKRDRRMVGQVRATGANVMLYGIGPVNWKDRRTIVPSPIPVSSLLIPSETEIDDFDNTLECFAVFREWTLSQLYDMTHGTKVDPGWNMELVQAAYDYIKDEVQKNTNASAFQFMPERVEELAKQDKGLFGSDAVPTVDVWDFYHKAEDNNGWYRKVILDWGVGDNLANYGESGSRPASRNKVKEKEQFLYSSGKRKYADSASEIIHCQFGDCSAYAPFKYHSIRSLGWMLWGVCDLQNRHYCKFNEALFREYMMIFMTAGNNDLIRIKQAMLEHMSIIPQGISFVTANERYRPDTAMSKMGFDHTRQLISDSAMSYTQEYDKGQGERTATETMAIVNSSQALASGLTELAYTYETYKYREMMRRLCLKNSTDPMAREFRLGCLKDGIPEEMLDVNKWNIEPEQVLGGGNKTLQMATVGFLNQIRKNLPPDGQRMVDHISVEAATDQPDLAEEMAPLGGNQPISNSTNNAQEATTRILRGLPYKAPKDAVYEDYITVWLHDLGVIIQQIFQRGGMATPDELMGLNNLAKHTRDFIDILANNEDEKDKAREYQDALAQLENHIKGLTQRFQESLKKQAGNGQAQGDDPKAAAAVQAIITQANTKAALAERAGTKKLEREDIKFAGAERRKDQQTAAEIARSGAVTRHEMMSNRLKVLNESDLTTESAAAEMPTE